MSYVDGFRSDRFIFKGSIGPVTDGGLYTVQSYSYRSEWDELVSNLMGLYSNLALDSNTGLIVAASADRMYSNSFEYDPSFYKLNSPVSFLFALAISDAEYERTCYAEFKYDDFSSILFYMDNVLDEPLKLGDDVRYPNGLDIGFSMSRFYLDPVYI